MLKQNKFITVFILLLVFCSPVVFSFIFYFSPIHFKTANRGNLLTPPVHLSRLLHQDKKQWQIVFAVNNCNDEHLQKTLFDLHQLRIALAENQQRVSLLLLTYPACRFHDTYDFRQKTFCDSDYLEWQQALHLADHEIMNKIYLVDTLDNVFMYYPRTTDLMNVFKDLKRVLGASQIG